MTDARIEEIIEEFSWLEDWENRYVHLISLGKALPPILDFERIEKNKVKGCVSQVWLVFDYKNKNELVIRGDSDAFIVKGLIALLIRLYTHRPPQEIIQINAQKLFQDLGLSQHLTPQRSNGFSAMNTKIHKKAQELLN